MKRIIGIILISALFTGCSTMSTTPAPPAAPKATWQDRQLSLNHIQSWWLSGKIGVQTANDAGSASVDWTQSARGYTISLLGPLGSHGMKLTGNASHVTLQTSDGKQYNANSAEQLLAKQWGFHLPVSNMTYWVRGLPVPGVTANTQFDQFGRLTRLAQQGWSIDYLSYANTNGIDLPERIAITSPALRVKIIINQWRIR